MRLGEFGWSCPGAKTTPIGRLVVRSRSAAFASAVLVVLVLAAAAGAAPAADLSFAAAVHYPTGRGPVAIAVGAFNGDGTQDLVTANARGSTASVLLGTGSGGFAAKTDFATGPFPCAVAVGDFNGDGAQDLVTADSGGDTASVLLGNGNGAFAAKTDFATGPDSYDVAVGDFNDDGMQDLVTVFTDSFIDQGAGVLLNDGAGDFPTFRAFATYLEPMSVAVGDLNGDGKQDLVTAGYTSSTAGVLLNGPRATPIILDLSPARGHIGATVTLTGWHFGAKCSTSLVRFGAKTATRCVSWSATKIKVKVPKGTAKGKVKVTVKTAAGRSAAKSFKRLQDAKRYHAHAFESDRRRPSPSIAEAGLSLLNTDATGLPAGRRVSCAVLGNRPHVVSIAWAFLAGHGGAGGSRSYIVVPVGLEVPPEVASIRGISPEGAGGEVA